VIADTLSTSNGSLVLAGTDTRFKRMNDVEIRRMVGRTVRVKRKSYRVGGVEVATSLAGGKNVFVKIDIPENDQISDFRQGQVAYVTN
jgi:hypothetical protein